jgi:hypothetical protein
MGVKMNGLVEETIGPENESEWETWFAKLISSPRAKNYFAKYKKNKQKTTTEETFIAYLDSQHDVIKRGSYVQLDSYFTYLTEKRPFLEKAPYVLTKPYERWLVPVYDTLPVQMRKWYTKYAEKLNLSVDFARPMGAGIGLIRFYKKRV